MKKYGRDTRPYVKPVTRIELSESNIKLRWILIVVLLSVGVVSIMVGLTSMLNTEPGWQTVEVSVKEASCAGDFTLQYDFSQAGTGATAQFKQLTQLYSEAAVKAYRLFSPEIREEGFFNVGYLNAHVNTPVRVEAELYEALSLAASYGSRQVFTAPAVVEYNRVFLCENSEEAVLYDPARDPENVAWLKELGRFMSDPDMIRLELIGDDQVQLSVAQEYLDFAGENEVNVLLDFGWMKNAFIADYLASVLVQNGYTHGYLASFDGFTRNLDDRGTVYSFNLFDRKGDEVYMPAAMEYNSPMSIVFLRDYPLGDQDRWHYYAFEDGNILTVMLDPATGLPKSGAANLVSYGNFSCGEILLRAETLFIADGLDADALNTMAGEAIYSVWFEGWNLKYNEKNLLLVKNPDGGAEKYSFTIQ